MAVPTPPEQRDVVRAVRRSLSLLGRTDRRRWLWLVPLALVAAGFEALGAALIFTLIRAISEPEAMVDSVVLAPFRTALGPERADTVVVVFAIAVAIFYVLKNAVLLFQSYAASRVAGEAVTALSRRLLGAYLSAPYSFHFHRSSADLIRNANDAVVGAFRGVILATVHVAVEAVLVLSLLVVLLITAPGVTLVASALLGVVLAGLLRVTQRSFALWGTRSYHLSGALMSSLQQSLMGVKEVKVLGREKHFLDAFGRIRDDLSRVTWLRATLESAPRLIVETVFVVGVVAVILAHRSMQAGTSLVPVLGLFAYAGFRMMPSLHRIVLNINSIRFGAPSVDHIYDDVLELGAHEAPFEVPVEKMKFLSELRFEGVSHTYRGGGRPAVHEISLVIRRGESVGVVGATGAGKSTLVDLVLGLLEPDEGRITVDGHDIKDQAASWRRNVGYVPQSVYLLDDTIRRNIALGLEDDRIDEVKVKAAVQRAQLESFVAALPNGLDTMVGERGIRLSGGERQRVAIARALYDEPSVLVFDEATSALDNQTEQEVTRAIEGLRGDKTLVVVAHRLSTVQRADRVVFLDAGRVADEGPFEALVERNEAFRKMALLTAAAEDPRPESGS